MTPTANLKHAIESATFLIAPPATVERLRKVRAFTPIAQYPADVTVCEGEVGFYDSIIQARVMVCQMLDESPPPDAKKYGKSLIIDESKQ